MNQVTFARSPKAPRHARPSNLALAPASLLPFREQYQALANALPPGTILIVVPTTSGTSGRIFETVAHQLAAQGHQIKMVFVDQLISPDPQ